MGEWYRWQESCIPVIAPFGNGKFVNGCGKVTDSNQLRHERGARFSIKQLRAASLFKSFFLALRKRAPFYLHPIANLGSCLSVATKT